MTERLPFVYGHESWCDGRHTPGDCPVGLLPDHTEALDVDVLARAMAQVEDRGLPMSPWNIAVAYRAAVAE